ncbi:cell division protein FtsL [uncultured Veillonella sp.]|uniref:cell division protein FtsL n=1 Tax=uncultured Veillonella sp. TaxID=159268 RepID=UPI0028DB4198|nr:cell division protein FtsL [uncultured Veillonella sp.]
MLARKAVVGQVKSDVLVATQGRKRSANVVLDLSPMMWQVIYGIAALVAFLLIMMFMNAYSTKLGYEVVKTQQAVVQLTKENDALDVEVASLKSPVRIQQIAEEQLGMVLPDSFVYSTKSAVTERNVQEKQQIID